MSGTAITSESSIDLAEAFVVAGDQAAASRLYHRHRDVTLKLAAHGMSDRLQTRIDPEDVYQSVSLILLRGLKKGHFRLTQEGDLRALLAQLTHHRIQKKVEQNTAAKRSLARETQLDIAGTFPVAATDCHDILEEQDEIAAFLSRISNPKHQEVVRLTLDGCTITEIASKCHYSAVRVRQILRSIIEQLPGFE